MTAGVRPQAFPIAGPIAGDFCEAIWPRLVGALSLSYGDRDLAEELAQEALSRVLERWDRVSALEDPEGYAFRVGFNVGRSWWRRRSAEARANERTLRPAAPQVADVALRVAVHSALGALSRRQREAIVYRYFLDRSVQDTASAMRCKEGTVKALTSQAIEVLRAQGIHVDHE